MALLDTVPVVLFFLGCIELMRAFYPRMSRRQYSLFSAGSVMVFLAGMMKAIWKFLYVLEICDYAILSDSFFPIQSAGFVLLALGTAGFAIEDKKEQASHNHIPTDYRNYAAVPVTASKMPFIILTFLGTTVFYGSLASIGFRKKNKLMAVFFIGAYTFDMIQVFLATKFEESASVMHWMAEIVNTIAQTCLWLGALRLNQEYHDEKYGY